jgi:hypothetical protein
MKKFTLLVIVVGAAWYLITQKHIFDVYVEKNLAEEAKIIPRAERAAGRERARVNAVHGVESLASGENVQEGMRPDEVRQVWADPTSIDRDAMQDEVWHYEALGKKVTFRKGRVWSIDPN